ncbi:MAG TPA: hypothetical protein VGB05_01085 [Pyrinomonadaceae bacterium]|jgi:hypothetical protein
MFESRLTTRRRAQVKRFCSGVLLYMAVLLLLAVFGVPLLSARVIGIGGCLVLSGLMLRFYFLLFKKDE